MGIVIVMINQLLVDHECLECGFTGEVLTESRKVTCPICKTINDFWLADEIPPLKHRNYIN